MSKKTWIIGGVAVAAVLGATIIGRTLAGASAKGADAASSGQVTTLKVAHTQNYVPYDFIDEKGESDGYEVAVLKAVDEKLADYKFEYTGTSDDDLLIGLESGKYDIGTKGAWYTDERAKKFIIPSELVGASIIGFTVRKEDEAKYKNIDDFAKNKGKLVPISPQNAQWNVINSYNEKHKDTPIELTAAESFKVADAYALFSVVDIKLLVDRSFKTNKMEFTDLSKRLYSDNIEDIYIILNDVDKSKIGYGYGYGMHKKMGNYYVTEEFEQDDVSILEKLIYKISDMTKKIRNIKK